MIGQEFKCELCEGTFTKTRSDEEVEQEMLDLWGDLPQDDRSTVCGECFKKMGIGNA